MKQTLLLLTTLTLLLGACKKETAAPVTATAVTLTKADLTLNNQIGAPTYNFFEVNTTTSPVTVPVRGENQVWDASLLTEGYVGVSPAAITASHTAFPSATYGRAGTEYFTAAGNITATPAVYYRELSESGIYNLGYSILACSLSAPTIGGTLTYPTQAIPFTGTTKQPILKFPAKYGDSTYINNLLQTLNFTANAPAMGVNNLPAQRTDKTVLTQSIMASGTIKLKGLGSYPVIVQKQVSAVTTNFFLAGAPAPTAMLTAIGITDGTTSTNVSYDFYAKDLGYCGSIYTTEAGAVYSAVFRKK